MQAPTQQFLAVGDGAARRRIATMVQPGAAPGVVWLQGFKSDMISTKATALAEWTVERGIAYTRFDYSGHGQSEGRFEDGTISRWLEEAVAVFSGLTTGPQVVVGSSMGGYLTLLLARQLQRTAPEEARRIKAMVLIAPAWDMTETLMWAGFPDAVKSEVMDTGRWLRPSQYGEPYPITRGLIEDGRRHLIGGDIGWDPGCPITIIHGRLDPDVPYRHSEALIGRLGGLAPKLIEVADGEHRLSRAEDLAILTREIAAARR